MKNTKPAGLADDGLALHIHRTPDEHDVLAPLDWRRGADPIELARMTPEQLEDADRAWERLSPEEQSRQLAELRIIRRQREDELANAGYTGPDAMGAYLADRGYPQPPALAAIRLSAVEPRALEWLWPGYVPLGKITIADGDPGLGKSTAMLDLACRGSRGATTPTGDPVGAAFVTLYVTSEDDPADTILPRVLRAGGDPRGIVILPRLSLPADVERLEAAVLAHRARLVIIDPLVAYLDGNVKANEDHHVRRALEPVAEMAARCHVAVVAIRHLNKQRGADALYRGGGSIGFTGLARSVLAFGRDPEDAERVVMASVKLNVGRRPPSLAFRLEADGRYDPAYVVWEGETSHTAEELIGRDQDAAKERSVTERMAEAIRELVTTHGGSLRATDAYDALRDQGFDTSSQNMVTRARKKAGVESVKLDFSGPWTWQLTNSPPVRDVGAFGAFVVPSSPQDTNSVSQDTTNSPKTPITVAIGSVGASVTIHCRDYLGHQTRHHRQVGGSWICDACPVAA